MSATPYEQFLALVLLDDHVVLLQRRLSELERSKERLEDEKAQKVAWVSEAKQRHHDEKKRCDALHLDLKSADQELTIKARQLETTRDVRRYEALSTEVQSLEAKKNTLEEEVFACWKRLEEYENEVGQRERSAAQLIENTERQLSVLASEGERFKREIRELETRRQAFLPSIRPEWLGQYEQMRTHMSNPVVPVESGYCSACGYQVPAGQLDQIRRHVLVGCQQCRRWLYLPVIEENHGTTEAV